MSSKSLELVTLQLYVGDLQTVKFIDGENKNLMHMTF